MCKVQSDCEYADRGGEGRVVTEPAEPSTLEGLCSQLS